LGHCIPLEGPVGAGTLEREGDKEIATTEGRSDLLKCRVSIKNRGPGRSHVQKKGGPLPKMAATVGSCANKKVRSGRKCNSRNTLAREF